MRTPIIRALSTLAITATLVACSGTGGQAARSQAVVASGAAASIAPTAAPPTASPASPTSSARPAREVGRAGVLAPGSYRYSQRAPAVTFTVPKDWVLTESMALHFGLRPVAFVADNSVRTWYDMRVASRDPSCPEAPDPEFGHTAADLLDAFVGRPGVVSTAPEPITLGGLEGHWIDVRVDEAWTEPCPFTEGMAATTLFTDDRVPDDPAFWGLGGYDERMRMIVLDSGAGNSVLVTIDAVDETTFDDLLAASMPVIETFEFEAP